MDPIANDLAQYLVTNLQSRPSTSRILVGLAGAPASGKTTLSALLYKHLERLAPGSSAIVPLDGWHYTRERLRTFPDPKEAFDRRGAEWTFDAEDYCQFVAKLREPISEASTVVVQPHAPSVVVTAPSFDHALKDPAPNAITVLPTHRIIIIEGLYPFLSIDRWKDAAATLDERWYVKVPEDEAQRRLVKRHVLTGVAKDEEEAIWRAVNNDVPNGQFIEANMLIPTRIIYSVDDATVASP